MPLKPQDLLVCLELATREDPRWTYADLSEALGISASEVNAGVDRAMTAGLLGPALERNEKPRPVTVALLEFVTHGVRYAFFARPGRIVRGWPTAHSAPPLVDLFQAGEEPPYVWPDAEGSVRGQAIEPLYPTVPSVARENRALYELLALIDGIRCGRARERRIATQELERRLIEGKGA
jgi:hypothetical protein